MSFQFSKTGQPIVNYLTISDDAFFHIKELLAARNEPCEGIKISVKTRGCSGMSYTIEYAVAEKILQNLTML